MSLLTLTTAQDTRTDFPHLMIGGNRADKLDRFELATTLIQMKIPGVTSESGKTDALRAFDLHQRKAFEAAR